MVMKSVPARAAVLTSSAGRHLLTEMVADAYIPNDTALRADSGRMQVITGPNFSGGARRILLHPLHLCALLVRTRACFRLLSRRPFTIHA